MVQNMKCLPQARGAAMRIIACLALHDVCAHEMVVKGLVPHMWTALLGTSRPCVCLQGPGIARVGGCSSLR